ncbi:MAG TPA: hypothetical protein VEV61_15070 [Streptosporangiaceae bacterium]|nr:hypothetical protein [Streptosporangiaceae bacterium]
MEESPAVETEASEPTELTPSSGTAAAVQDTGAHTTVAGQSAVGRASRFSARRVPGWAIALAIYLLLAIGAWWHVWAGGHPDSTMTADLGDPSSFVWFLEWPAYAISHGHNLFLATRDHVPAGLNLLDNTSVLALGIVLTPVTLLFGPVATLNVALTAAPALSAISAYGCLRRGLGLWRPAAFIAGLLFGFSPYVQRNLTFGHLQVTFLALVPLITLCAYELIVTQRGRWWRWGLLLGLLVTIQFFIGSEVLTLVTITVAGSALLALIGAALSRRQDLAAKLPDAVKGLALAGATGGVLLAYPVWFAIRGPDHITGSDWGKVSTFPLDRVLFRIPESQGFVSRLPFAGYLGPSGLSGGYLGLAAILLVVAAAIVVRRPLSRLCLVIMVVGIWASFGAYHHLVGLNGHLAWLPSIWRLVRHMPVLDQATPQNCMVVAIWATAVSAALLIDWIWQRRSGAPLAVASARISRSVLAGAGALAISAAFVVPWLVDWPMPFTTESVATPPGVSHVLDSLPADSVVLFYPFPSSALDAALVWQAQEGMRFKVAGGRGITAGPGGAANHGLNPATPQGMLSALSTYYTPHGTNDLPPMPSPQVVTSMRLALRQWKVTNVVMAGGGRNPAYAKQWLTRVLGAPPHLQAGIWVWTGVQQLIS